MVDLLIELLIQTKPPLLANRALNINQAKCVQLERGLIDCLAIGFRQKFAQIIEGEASSSHTVAGRTGERHGQVNAGAAQGRSRREGLRVLIQAFGIFIGAF
jgi:hypothetical protein